MDGAAARAVPGNIAGVAGRHRWPESNAEKRKKACVAASARVGTLSQNGYGALSYHLAGGLSPASIMFAMHILSKGFRLWAPQLGKIGKIGKI